MLRYWLCLCVLLLAAPVTPVVVNVAVVGSGLSGSAFTYHLHRLATNGDVEYNVTVLEKFEDVGGRTKTVVFEGVQMEVGASIIHGSNQEVLALVKKMGLHPVAPLVSEGEILLYEEYVTTPCTQHTTMREGELKGLQWIASLIPEKQHTNEHTHTHNHSRLTHTPTTTTDSRESRCEAPKPVIPVEMIMSSSIVRARHVLWSESYVSVLKAILRWGWRDQSQLQTLVNDMVSNFTELYRHMDEQELCIRNQCDDIDANPWASPHSLLKSVGLFRYTLQNYAQYLHVHGISGAQSVCNGDCVQCTPQFSAYSYATELLEQMSRVNYMQTMAQMNALAGMVSVVPLVMDGEGIECQNTHADTHTRTHSRAHTHTDTDTHAHTHAHTDTHTHFGRIRAHCPVPDGPGNYLFMVREGNQELSRRLLGNPSAANTVLTKATVTHAHICDEKVQLRWREQSDSGTTHTHTETFDKLVVAAPMEIAGISVTPKDAFVVPPPRNMKVVWVTFVRGVVNHRRFKLSDWIDGPSQPQNSTQYVDATDNCEDFHRTGADGEPEPFLGHIITTVRTDARLPFVSLSVYHRFSANNQENTVNQDENSAAPLSHYTGEVVVKLFSHSELNRTELSPFFRCISRMESWHIGAYPQFNPPEQFAPFALRKGLVYYPNAFENAASCLETCAIAARSVAMLMHRDVQDQVK